MKDLIPFKYNTLGEYVHSARRHLNLTQEKLAEASGITRTTIIMIEHDRSMPGFEKLTRLLHTLYSHGAPKFDIYSIDLP